jgi:hypothetical protein
MNDCTAKSLTFDEVNADDPAALRRLLDDVDQLGWESPSGTLVLEYALDRIVRPAVRRAELTGHRKADAISAGWIEAWRMLSRPDVRDQSRPWGIVTAAVRREITTDQVGAAYRTESRRAWRIARRHRACTPVPREPHRQPDSARPDHRSGRFPDQSREGRWLGRLDPRVSARPLSLDRMMDAGWEPAATRSPTEILGPRLNQVVDALVAVGWSRGLAAESLAGIAEATRPTGVQKKAGVELRGWRELSQRTDLPGWQTRRLAALLLGHRGQPGLIERMVLEGDQVLHTPEAQRLLRSTVHRWASPPSVVARATAAASAARAAA